MKLLGIAIIGKSNEPLYLCGCENIARFGDAAPSTGDNKDSSNPDHFGFGLTSQTVSSKNQGQSLSIEHQLLLHASLDPLEEMIGSSKQDGTMPLRRNSNYSAWLGLLTILDGTCAVYGHVSATNIKFLALCETETIPGKSSPWVESVLKTTSSSSSLSPAEQKIKKLLSSVHKHYADYIMNPFSKPTEPILQSPNFDKQVRQTVDQYQDRGESLTENTGAVPTSKQ